MGRIVVVPNELRDAINRSIDTALNGRPIEHDEREVIYRMILRHYDEHGAIPDFSLLDADHQPPHGGRSDG